MTAAEDKLVRAAGIIATSPPSQSDFVFQHAVLCQVGLPRSRVSGREFFRKNGDAWISIQAGWLDEAGTGPVAQEIPYGALPRLVMAWLSTFAIRNNTREIPIGASASEFLRHLQMDDQGRRYVTLRRQMHALAACHLQIGYRGCTMNQQPIAQFDAWMPRHQKTHAHWPGVLVLSEDYFVSLLESAMPLDYRALSALRGSALALDIYTWLAHRLHRIQGRPLILHWAPLRRQFADEYKGADAGRNFKKNFLRALRAALAVYPQAQVKRVPTGLLLAASPPPIPYKNGPAE